MYSTHSSGRRRAGSGARQYIPPSQLSTMRVSSRVPPSNASDSSNESGHKSPRKYSSADRPDSMSRKHGQLKFSARAQALSDRSNTSTPASHTVTEPTLGDRSRMHHSNSRARETQIKLEAKFTSNKESSRVSPGFSRRFSQPAPRNASSKSAPATAVESDDSDSEEFFDTNDRVRKGSVTISNQPDTMVEIEETVEPKVPEVRHNSPVPNKPPALDIRKSTMVIQPEHIHRKGAVDQSVIQMLQMQLDGGSPVSSGQPPRSLGRTRSAGSSAESTPTIRISTPQEETIAAAPEEPRKSFPDLSQQRRRASGILNIPALGLNTATTPSDSAGTTPMAVASLTTKVQTLREDIDEVKADVSSILSQLQTLAGTLGDKVEAVATSVDNLTGRLDLVDRSTVRLSKEIDLTRQRADEAGQVVDGQLDKFKRLESSVHVIEAAQASTLADWAFYFLSFLLSGIAAVAFVITNSFDKIKRFFIWLFRMEPQPRPLQSPPIPDVLSPDTLAPLVPSASTKTLNSALKKRRPSDAGTGRNNSRFRPASAMSERLSNLGIPSISLN